MRKFLIYSVVGISIIAFIIQQKNKRLEYLYNEWSVPHIIREGKELFDNDIKKNGFDILFIEGGKMKISKNKMFFVYHKRAKIISSDGTIRRKEPEKPTEIKSNFFEKNDSLFVEMKHPIKKEFNGTFYVHKEEDIKYINSEAIKEIRLILQNKSTSIYLKRYDSDKTFIMY